MSDETVEYDETMQSIGDAGDDVRQVLGRNPDSDRPANDQAV
jgi:hypothetical protein